MAEFDCRWRNACSPQAASCGEFDKHFELETAYADEQFRTAHAQFYAKGKEAHSFSPKEQAEFEKIRCLAGCKSEFLPVQTR
jgi:hypothetical protein